MNKRNSIFIILGLFFLILLILSVSAQNSENSSEWWMFGKYLNHTSWDGINFPIISGLNNATFIVGLSSNPSSAVIANGSVYIGSDFEGLLYQLNASNISQQINNYNVGQYAYISPIVVNGYVYVGGSSNNLYQLNASNISKLIANFTTGDNIRYSPIFANGSIFLGSNDGYLYQLNASNISKQINNISIGAVTTSPAIANGYVYVGGGNSGGGKGGGTSSFYQLNASNISQQIANFTLASATIYSSPAIFNNFAYVGDNAGNFYQLNASNVSQQISTFVSTQQLPSSPAIANGYVYVPILGGGIAQIYQLNASNVSQQISTFIPAGGGGNSPAIANGYLYMGITLGGGAGGMIYQLNASNISQQIANFTTTLPGAFVSSSSTSIANGYLYLGFGSSTNGGIIYQINTSDINLTSCTESWSCGSWGNCNGGTQTRTCVDSSNCGTVINRPAISQSCTSPGIVNTTITSGPITTTTPVLISSISSGTPITIDINSSIGVNQLTITTNKSFPNANFSILSTNHPSIMDLQIFGNGSIYQAFNITTMGLDDNNIANVKIRFQVNISWFISNNLDPLTTILYRNTNTIGMANWIALPTTLISQDSQYYYFVAASPGFSSYSIFAAAFSCTSGNLRCFLNDSQICTDGVWLLSKNCQIGCNEGRCIITNETMNFFHNIFNTFSANFNINKAFYYFIAIIILSFIIAVYTALIMRKRKKKISN